MFQAVVQEARNTKSCVLVGLREEVELKINVLQAIHFTVAAWRQVMQSTILNCFHQCGYGRELNIEADTDSSIEDDDFHED
jgi:hypothetical protein